MTGPTRRELIVAGAAFALAGRAVAAPTRLHVANDRVFLDAVVNDRPTTAILDSAAEMTVLDSGFAAALGLRGGARAEANGTGRATIGARLVAGVELELAGLTLRPRRVAVIDLGDISRRLALERVDMIAGREIFDAARLRIDLRGGELHVVPRALVPAGVRLPLTPQRGIEAVPVTVEGRPALADFDLGNGGTVLIGAAYARARGFLDDRAVGTIKGGGIGGEGAQATFTLRTLDVAGRRFTDVPVAIDASPTAADANIGVRLLRGFDIVTDFPQRAVWLDPRA